MGLRPIPQYYMQMIEWWDLSALYAVITEWEECQNVISARIVIRLKSILRFLQTARAFLRQIPSLL